MVSAMKVVVTGGGGFVMANFLRHWLEADAGNQAVALDATPLDAPARRYFEPVSDRLQFIEGDVAAADIWSRLPSDSAYVVHGAAVTPHAHADAAGRWRDPEREDPLRVLNANIMGTAQALNWARGLPSLRRFVYVSTGSVYVDSVAEQERKFFPLPEDGYIGPRALYDVSKYSAELVARRFKELYALDLAIVRLSSVFGPMDRQTSARNVRNIANHVAHAAAAGRVLRSTSAEAVGDYVYAPDVADALRRLLMTPRGALRHDIYNIACGITASVRDLASYAREAAPEFALEITDGAAADIRTEPDRRTGRWAAYDIARAENDFGWRPRPPAVAMRDYISWLRAGGN
jgi:UDP-glucose 4-epimerase